MISIYYPVIILRGHLGVIRCVLIILSNSVYLPIPRCSCPSHWSLLAAKPSDVWTTSKNGASYQWPQTTYIAEVEPHRNNSLNIDAQFPSIPTITITCSKLAGPHHIWLKASRHRVSSPSCHLPWIKVGMTNQQRFTSVVRVDGLVVTGISAALIYI